MTVLASTQSAKLSDLAAPRSCTQRPTELWMLKVESTLAGSSTGVVEYAYANRIWADPSRFATLPSKSAQLENPLASSVAL